MSQTIHERIDRFGLLPTPEMPSGAGEVQLTDNACQVLIRRYVRRDREGKPAESIEGMFWRVADHVAKVEQTWDGNEIDRAGQFYKLLTSKKFFPHSPHF